MWRHQRLFRSVLSLLFIVSGLSLTIADDKEKAQPAKPAPAKTCSHETGRSKTGTREACRSKTGTREAC